MPTYDYTCETCGREGRAHRREEQGPPRFCNRDCQKKSDNPLRRGKPVKWRITPEMHNAIRAAYQGDTGKSQINDLAGLLGLPRWKVTRYAIIQGWTARQKKEPEWSERELKLLKLNAHLSPTVIQRRLRKYGYHRTEVGIVLKRKRMRFLQNLSGNSSRSVAQCLGIDSHTVAQYIQNGWLKAGRRGTNRTAAQGGDFWYIKDKDIRKFIVENVAVVDFRKLDKYWLVNLLAGKSMKRLKTVSLIEERKSRREQRSFAALHCVRYIECLDRAVKTNNKLNCHNCDMLEFSRDNYQKEIGLHSINNYEAGEHTIRIDCNERH